MGKWGLSGQAGRGGVHHGIGQGEGEGGMGRGGQSGLGWRLVRQVGSKCGKMDRAAEGEAEAPIQ